MRGGPPPAFYFENLKIVYKPYRTYKIKKLPLFFFWGKGGGNGRESRNIRFMVVLHQQKENEPTAPCCYYHCSYCGLECRRDFCFHSPLSHPLHLPHKNYNVLSTNKNPTHIWPIKKTTNSVDTTEKKTTRTKLLLAPCPKDFAECSKECETYFHVYPNKKTNINKHMNEDTQIFLATSLSLTSILLGIIGVAVKSECEHFNCCWGALQCQRKQKANKKDENISDRV